MATLIAGWAAATLVFCAPAVTATVAGPTPDADENVHVYTNEDLDKLPPIAPLVIVDESGRPLEIEGAAQRWAFVQSVLDQAYARIDADRAYRTERRRVEAETEALGRIESRPRYVLPFSYYGYTYPREAVRARPHPPRREAGWPRKPPLAELFRPITPLHARRP